MKALVALACAACWTGEPPPPGIAKPPAPRGPNVALLTPGGLDKIWLSMPLAAFEPARPHATRLQDVDDGERWRYHETRPGPGVAQAEYYFGVHEPHPLYEIRATYEDEAHARFALDDRYTIRGLVTPPAFDDEHLSYQVVIKTTKFDVGAWTYGATLIVAAALPATERANGQFQEPLP